MRARAVGVAAVLAGAGWLATINGYGPIASSHLGAPVFASLSITCVAPDHPALGWIRDSRFSAVEKGGAPISNEREYLGWTEYLGCQGPPLKVGLGTR